MIRPSHNQTNLNLPFWAIKYLPYATVNFVDNVMDIPDQKIELKAFCAEIINEHEGLNQEQERYKALPVSQRLSRFMC